MFNHHQVVSSQAFSQSIEEIEERIRQVEIQYDLLQYQLDGWCAWPILRFEISNLLANLSLVAKRRLRREERVAIALGDIFSLLKMRNAHYAVKTYTSGLAEQEGNRYKDIWFDDLLNEMGDYYKIETINNPAFLPRRQSALIKSDLTPTLLDFTAAFLRRLGNQRDAEAIAPCLSACIRDKLGIEACTTRWVLARLLFFYWSKKVYVALLKRIRPAYLLTVDPSEYSLVAAAKEQKIQVIELQHGFLDRNQHGAYAWTDYASKYKTRMQIPDRLFLYGEYWKQELDANGFWGDTLRTVGSIRMDQYRKLKTVASKGNRCTLVLTTQGLDVPETISFVKALMEAAANRLDLFLYIKLHPIYETSKEQYMNAFQTDQRVRVLLGSEAPSTFELLSQANLHLSISSTCHYEALGLGVPTVILPFSTHEVVLRLHQVGHAFLVRTPLELLVIAEQWRDLSVPSEVSEQYFKPNALENIKRELGVV